VTNEEVQLLLELFAQVYNADEPTTVDDASLDSWWETVATKLEAIAAICKKRETKDRMREHINYARRIIKDTVSWMREVGNSLSRNPRKAELAQIVRRGLDEGRKGMLARMKEDIKQAIAQELSGGGG
jgi:benzoyl-CoA reductase/2-hydroxyglutaryl-CoA dehydratase subunit BcrC/BadD/HgdB